MKILGGRNADMTAVPFITVNSRCLKVKVHPRRLISQSKFDEDVGRKIQAAIGKYDKLLILIQKLKLRWFGHISRSSGIAKTILQGTVQGTRRKGRQKKRWEDNIKDWTGMD